MAMPGPDRPQPASGDLVASALGATWARLASALRVGWARESGGVQALVTGVPIAGLNGVWALRARVDEPTVQAGLEAVAEERVPFCLQVRPAWREGASAIAAAWGLVAQPEIPLMATADLVAGSPADGVSIRLLGPGEAWLHSEVAGPAFGAPPELFAQLVTTEVLGLSEIRAYVGVADGEPAVTALSVTIGQAVGVFNVATVEHRRRRGYGAAITARAVRDAMDAGASWAWLQSSDSGYRVYERLGFTTIERWPCWVSES